MTHAVGSTTARARQDWEGLRRLLDHHMKAMCKGRRRHHRGICETPTSEPDFIIFTDHLRHDIRRVDVYFPSFRVCGSVRRVTLRRVFVALLRILLHGRQRQLITERTFTITSASLAGRLTFPSQRRDATEHKLFSFSRRNLARASDQTFRDSTEADPACMIRVSTLTEPAEGAHPSFPTIASREGQN